MPRFESVCQMVSEIKCLTFVKCNFKIQNGRQSAILDRTNKTCELDQSPWSPTWLPSFVSVTRTVSEKKCLTFERTHDDGRRTTDGGDNYMYTRTGMYIKSVILAFRPKFCAQVGSMGIHAPTKFGINSQNGYENFPWELIPSTDWRCSTLECNSPTSWQKCNCGQCIRLDKCSESCTSFSALQPCNSRDKYLTIQNAFLL